ncbi:MAG: TonB-dependent receptor, partial [Rubrivivax sp.]|nr:TonB-dependent receptor [Rubrivivax sp.]
MKPTRLTACLLLAFGGPLMAQPAPAPAGQRIEITGSHVKRLSAEGPVPVEVITRADIERMGVRSTNDLLRSLTAMSSLNDELLSNSPNLTGTAGAGFRGLASDQTVVLLNGRRLASHGFDGAFVNLNTIPLGVVQRVELLKDGAAAIYGADAIGGVINFITRRDLQGADLSASASVTDQGGANELGLAGTLGFGDLGSSGYNLLLNLSYFRRDPLDNLDRERTRTVDFRRFGGGSQLSVFAPTGNFVHPGTGRQAPFNPCPDPALLSSPSPLTPGDAGSSSCLFDFAPYRTTLFGTERVAGFAAGRLRLGGATAFAEALLSRSDSTASAAPTPGVFNLPAGHPANPYGAAIVVRGRPLQAGPRVTQHESEASRLLVGLEGQIGVQDFNVAAGRARSSAKNTDSGYFLQDRLLAAIAQRRFDPFSQSNAADVIASLSSTDRRLGLTTHRFVDARLSGDLFDAPGGPAGYAAGLVVARESIEDLPGPQLRAGNVFGSIQQSMVVAERSLAAAHVELAVPLARAVEAQLALRHDRYGGGSGSSTTPKLALRWQPAVGMMLRGSYAEGFKMPSLRDLHGGLNQSADSVQDFPGCSARGVPARDCPRLQYDRFSGGNPGLRPEQARSWNLGFAVEPTRDLSLALDRFIIDKTDEIGLVLTQYVIDNVPYVPGATTTLGGNPVYSVTRNAGGTITAVNTSLGNLGRRRIRGLDATATVRWQAPLGRVALDATGTYYDRYDYADQPGTPLLNRLGLLNLPRWKTRTRLSLEQGAWNGALALSSRARMWDKPQSTAATPVSPSTGRVGHFDT